MAKPPQMIQCQLRFATCTLTTTPFPESPPLLVLHVREQELEAIAQRAHVLIWDAAQLERPGDDLDVPVLDLGALPVLEAEEEVAWVLGVDAEIVDGPLRVRFRVGG